MLGGYHGFPARLGGSKPVARIYHEALRSALPSAIRSVPGSLADCETLATARLLATMWKAQQRYEANLSPRTAYALLGNWAERFRVPVREGDSVEYIQALCAWKHRVNLYGSTDGALWDACKLVLGEHLVNIEYHRGNSLTSPPPNTYWPESPGSMPWTSSRSLIIVQAMRGELSSEEFRFLMNVRLAEVLDVLAAGYGSWSWQEVDGPTVSDPSEGFDSLFGVAADTLWFASDQGLPQASFVTRKGLPWHADTEPGTTVSKLTSTWALDGLPTVNFGGAGASARVGLRCDGFAPGTSNAKFHYTLAGPCVLPIGLSTVYAFSGLSSSHAVRQQISAGGNLLFNATASSTTVVGSLNTGPFPHGERAILAVTARPNPTTPANTDVFTRVKTASGTFAFAGIAMTIGAVGSFSRFALGFTPFNPGTLHSANAAWGGFVGYKGFGATDTQLDQLISQWESIYRLS